MMTTAEFLLARKLGKGSGGDVTIEQLNVTANGTYQEEGKAYSPVVVNVPTPENSYQLKSIENTPTDIATFNASALPMPSLKVSIEAQQSGSGDPSPTNIRPISGWTEANVVVSGVNVWDEEWEVGSISDANGQDATNNNYRRSKNYISVKANKKYYFNVPNKYGTTYRFYQYKQNKDYIGIKTVDSDGTFETDNDCAFIRFRIATTEDYTNDISINYPSTDTEYHAYSGQTYTIDLGGTRYGGTLDVVSGELVVDRVMVDLGTLSWSVISAQNGVFGATVNGIKTYSYGDTPDMLCSAYKTAPTSYNDPYISANGIIWTYAGVSTLRIKDTAYSDATAFKTAMNGVQLVYELATPQTIQLTPTAVKSLLGTNNLWADSGDVLEGSYFKELS